MRNLLSLRATLLSACVLAALPSAAQNLVQDGDFEIANGTAGFYTGYGPGQSFDGGLWTVTLGGVGVDETTAFVISGTSSLFMGVESAVSQTLATMTGTTYRVSFDAYAITGPMGADLLVGFGGATTAFVVPNASHLRPPTPVSSFSFLVTTAATNAPLSFTLGNNSSLVLDNVSVQAVPEPATLAILGLGALGLRRRRRG